jgi:hypothetical protein
MRVVEHVGEKWSRFGWEPRLGDSRPEVGGNGPRASERSLNRGILESQKALQSDQV